MARHALVPAPDDPGERVKRTGFQTIIPAVLVLVVVGPTVIEIVDEELGDRLPEGFRLWMLAAAGFLTAVAMIISRVSAIPEVNDWLSRIGLGTVPARQAREIHARAKRDDDQSTPDIPPSL